MIAAALLAAHLAALVVLPAPPPVAGAASLCDQPRVRSFRYDGETNLVIRALDATVRASDALPPFVFAEWQPPGKRPEIAGQVVRVEQVIGASDEALRRALRSDPRVVLVPWDHDTGCEPIPWTASPRWITPGTLGFVAARLRPRDKWAGGLPTFDVRDAWREPYTVKRARALYQASAEGAAIMTPAEFGGFYETFPLVSGWQRDPRAALAPALAWSRANPTLAAKEPARTMLQTMLRASYH